MKLLVIGLDGGDIGLIEKWRYELPNLNRLMQNGVLGPLESCIPPLTSPAWDCMFTGKNPAKLGIYDFILFPIDKETGPKIRGDLHGRTRYLWDLLGDRGIRVAIMGVPNTYPARQVNGVMVSGGLLTLLAKGTPYTYPASLAEELDRVVHGYEIFPLTELEILNRENEYIEEYNRILDKQTRAAKYLMSRYPWDLFVCVFFDVDSVQHYLWGHMDDSHPKWTKEKGMKHGDAIKNFYKRIDSAIGILTNDLSSETVVMVVSDHGGGPLYGDFCINEWLRQKGLLKLRDTHDRHGAANAAGALFRKLVLGHFNPQILERLLKLVPKRFLERFTLREAWKDSAQQLLDRIDWSHTKAYGVTFQSIFINTKGSGRNGTIEPGEEYEGVRDQIIRGLSEIRDPRTGIKAVSRVFKKEELYNGEYLDKAPDLINWMGNLEAGTVTFRQSSEIKPGKLWADSPNTGHHNLYGVLIISGPNVKKGEQLRGARIYDITPSVLHMFGVPIPSDMDGRVLDIFERDSPLSRRPIATQQLTERERILTRIRVLKSQGRL